jgi:hypothetical protein
MKKEAFILVSACLGMACSHQNEPNTPAASQEQQMTPASGDEPIEREYPPPPPPPVVDDQDDTDEEGLDYTTPPSDPGEYRDSPEAPPP